MIDLNMKKQPYYVNRDIYMSAIQLLFGLTFSIKMRINWYQLLLALPLMMEDKIYFTRKVVILSDELRLKSNESARVLMLKGGKNFS